jgi:formylglycine-generating enzyme required for sulfatase activity
MGSPTDEVGYSDDERQHRRRIPRSFAVATRPVTVTEFKKFRPDFPYLRLHRPDPSAPINSVSWYDAAAYCRWLSEQEGIPEGEMCYPPVADIEKCRDSGKPLKLPEDYLSRTAYRLPTEAEWEYACRAGSVTPWAHGFAEGLLDQYAWYQLNAGSRTHPAGVLKPNDLGLFDMHGNAWQWCQNPYKDLKDIFKGNTDSDEENSDSIKKDEYYVVRGGSCLLLSLRVRSASRLRLAAAEHNPTVGFRPARTYR